MVLSLQHHQTAVQPVEGRRAFKFRIVNGHIGANGAVVNRMANYREGDSGIPNQKPGVIAHFCGKGVEGYIRGMGGQDRLLFKRGEVAGVLNVNLFVVAYRAARRLIIGIKEKGKP